MLNRGRDPRREIEEQAAFEEAERVRAEARANAAFDGFIDSGPVSIEVFDVSGKLLRSNKAAERLLGKVPPPGISLFDERGLKRAGMLEPQIKRVLAGTRVETPPTWYDPTEIGLPGIPGTKVRFRATVFPLFDNEGRVMRIAVIHEDLTELAKAEASLKEERSRSVAVPAPSAAPPRAAAAPAPDVRDVEFQRRKVEQALRESEERYRSFVDSARGYVVARFSEDGHILALSPSVEEWWGIKRDTVLVDNAAFFSRIHPDDMAKVKATEAEARKTGVYPAAYEFRVAHATKSDVAWLQARGSVGAYAGKRTFDLVITDIGDRKRLESELADRDRKLAVLADSPTEGVFIINADWVVQTWSPGAERETRITATEAKGKRLWDLYPDLEKSGFAAPCRRTLIDRVAAQHEGFYQDGREKYAGWFSLCAYPHGAGLLGIIRNVSSRKKSELAWQEAESRLKALLDQPGVLITLKDDTLRYVFANPAALKAYSFGRAETLVGKTDPELYNAKVSNLLAVHDRQVLDKGKPVELELALPDGASPKAAWFHVTKQPWRNAAGNVIGIYDITYDITARVKAQQELARRRDYLEKLLADQGQALRKAQEELTRWQK